MKKTANNKSIMMADFLYPHLIHVPLPNAFYVDRQNVRGIVSLGRHYVGLTMTDHTNQLIAHSDSRIFTLEKQIDFEGGFDKKAIMLGIVPDGFIDQSKNLHQDFVSTNPYLFCMQIDAKGELPRIFHTRYSTHVRVYWKVKRKEEYDDNDFNRGRDIFDVFVTSYRNISGDLYTSLLKDTTDPHIEYIFIHDAEDMPLGPIDLQYLNTAREFKFIKERILFSFGDQRIPQRDPTDTANQLNSRLRENNTDTASELLDEARVALNTKRDFKRALLEAFFAIELLIDQFVTRAKIARGVNEQTIKKLSFVKNFTYMMLTELPLLLKEVNDQWNDIFKQIEVIKEVRNDVVHRGKYPTEQEAKLAVDTAARLRSALLNEQQSA